MDLQKYSLYLKPSFSVLIFSYLFISLSAVTLTLSTYLILNKNFSIISIPSVSIIFFATLIIYNFHAGKEVQNYGNTFYEKWRAENIYFLRYILLISFLGVICAIQYLPLESIFLLFHLGVISFLYVTSGKYSIRKLPLVKIFALSYVWSSATVFVPAIDIEVQYERETIMLFLERFLFIFALAIPFDIRDFHKDKMDSLLTIPNLIGIRNSKILIFSIFSLFLLLSLFNYGLDFVFFSRMFSVLAVIFLIKHTNEYAGHSFYMFWIDGIMILYFLSLSIFHILI